MTSGLGCVARGVQRAFVVSNGEALGSRTVFAWAYPRVAKLKPKPKHHVHIHHAARRLGLRAVRLRDPITGRFTGAVWYVPDPAADKPPPTLEALRGRARRKLKALGFRPVRLSDGTVEWRKPGAGE